MPEAVSLPHGSELSSINKVQPGLITSSSINSTTKHRVLSGLPPKSHKRRVRDWELLQTPDSDHGSFKKQKCFAAPRAQSPSKFWDNLDKVCLTKNALRELDRRNSTSLFVQHSPVTRSLASDPGKGEAIVTADTYVQHCHPTILLDLRHFARQGGPDMSDARGRSRSASGLRRSIGSGQDTVRRRRQNPTPMQSEGQSTATSKTRSSGPYDRNFKQHLLNHNVLPDGYVYPDGSIPPLPCNWTEIQERLMLPRRSLSPSKFTNQDFVSLRIAQSNASKGNDIANSVLPVIEGLIEDRACTSGGLPFRNFDPLTDVALVPGNPDIYYGARPEQLDRRVLENLKSSIQPTTQADLPICPNFVVALKGPDGQMGVAQLQASYDGALCARGIHSLQTYSGGHSSSDSKASTISIIYYCGSMKIYTIHRVDSTNTHGYPAYYMHQLRSIDITDKAETCRQAISAYRNARDWAREQRNEAIERANRAIIDSTIEAVNLHAPSLERSVESDDHGFPLIDESPNPGSARFTTPPTEQTSFSSDTNKRSRQQRQENSPVQQQKRNRNRKQKY